MGKIILLPYFIEGVLHKLLGNTPLFFIICGIAITVIPYLLGSINFAVVISARRYNDDVREHGSGNAGMTNMMRTYGRRAAILTLIGDALKAIVAIAIGYVAFGLYGAHVAAFFCILGHLFPIFFKFKGGKGVVTTAAAMLMCSPLTFIISLTLFITIVAIWKYISLASIMCALLYPVILNGVDTFLVGGAGLYIIFPVLTTVLVVIKHKENIKRLLEGKESKFKFKKSVKKNESKDN